MITQKWLRYNNITERISSKRKTKEQKNTGKGHSAQRAQVCPKPCCLGAARKVGVMHQEGVTMNPQAPSGCPTAASAAVQSPTCAALLCSCSDTAVRECAANPRKEKPWKHLMLHSANTRTFPSSRAGF